MTNIRRVVRVDDACAAYVEGVTAGADAIDNLDDLERVDTVDAVVALEGLVFLAFLLLDERSRRRIIDHTQTRTAATRMHLASTKKSQGWDS